MKHIMIASVLLIVILLFAACGQAPSIAVTSVPAGTHNPSDAVTDSPQPDSAGLYSGPYEDDRLPMLVLEIRGADKRTFNPDKIYDYLATAPSACYDYQIINWKVKEGILYLTISACLNFWEPSDAYYYIRDAFSLTDEEMFRIPFFSKCIIDGDYLSIDSELDYTGYKESVLGPLPVADDAPICLPSEYSPDIDTVEEFIDKFVNGNIKDSIEFVSFSYENGQITEIYSEEENEEGDYDDEGDYNDEGGYDE